MSNVISSSIRLPSEPWVRLWLPEDSWQQHRWVDDSFLPIYKDDDGTAVIEKELPGLTHLSSLADIPFLLLLGRPGSGKSHELEAARKEGWFGPGSHFFEAKEIGSAHPGDYIAKNIPPDQPTRIVIDGLDEALLSNPNFVSQLRLWLRRQLTPGGHPIHRLAISCRWSRPIEHLADLTALWPNDTAETYILCPLRRCDFTATLEAALGKSDAQKFWQQMHDRHLESVACWPQGFLGLRQSFEKSGRQHLSTHGDAIREQVLSHCLLTDSPEDSPRWEKSLPDAQWRQRIAGRVAAAMIWSGKALLALKNTPQDDALTLADLSHSDELWQNQHRSLQLADLDDLRNHSTLFHPLSGSDRWSFQSQVHQEWLAADWLSSQKLDTSRLQMLFGTEIDGQWCVFPALRSVAAWLARVDGDFRDSLRQHDPLTLLWLDAASLPHPERKEIVEALLEATAKAKVVDPAIRQSHLVSLDHSGLDAQLRRWLARSDVDEAAHELALEIAEKAEVKSLTAFLWEIYPAASSRLQIDIAGALHRLAREGFDEQWKAVLHKETPVDLHGTLLGTALDILVVSSDKVPVRDVLEWLVPRIEFGEDCHLYGLYDTTAPKVHLRLTADDLPATFRLLGQKSSFIHDSLSFAHDLNQSALKLAAENVDVEDVVSALVEYWHACVAVHHPPHHGFNNVWDSSKPPFDDPLLRRRIIPHLIHHPGFEKNTKRQWVSASEWLVSEADFEWCLDELLAAAKEDEWRYALLVRNLVRHVDLSGRPGCKLIEAASKSSFFRELLPEAQNDETVVEALHRVIASSNDEHRKQVEVRESRQAQREAAYQKRLQAYAETLEKEHASGLIVWPGVLRFLSAREHGLGSHSTEFGPEQKISENDSWMRDSARRYLFEAPLDQAEDVNEGINGLMALSACWAEFQLPSPVRDVIAARWIPLLYSTLSSFGGFGTAPEGLSVGNLAKLFPDEFALAFGKVIRCRYLAKGSLGELRSLKDHWSAAMSQQLLAVVTEEEIQPEGFPNAIRALAHFSEADALQAGNHWLERQKDIQTPEARAAMLAGCAFLVNGRLATEVRKLLQNTELVRNAVFHATRTLDSITSRPDFSAWPAHAILELANAIWRAFPQMYEKDYGGGFSSVTGMDYAKDFRDQITNAAVALGLDVAIPVVHTEDNEKQAERRQRTLNWHRLRAAQARAGEAWQHLKPEIFFQLTSRPHARLARNADELLTAVIESLQRWETNLRAGDWHRLWDIRPQKPKHEKIISREMRQWLKSDLDVLAETEVELASQDRTDILVQVTPQDSAQTAITVVIEVKKLRAGNKDERQIAMRTQLLDRYLKPCRQEGWTHGLYVVAWTPEPGTSEDSDEVLQAASGFLSKQAESLSQGPFTLQSMVIDARFINKDKKTAGTKVRKPLSSHPVRQS